MAVGVGDLDGAQVAPLARARDRGGTPDPLEDRQRVDGPVAHDDAFATTAMGSGRRGDELLRRAATRPAPQPDRRARQRSLHLDGAHLRRRVLDRAPDELLERGRHRAGAACQEADPHRPGLFVDVEQPHVA